MACPTCLTCGPPPLPCFCFACLCSPPLFPLCRVDWTPRLTWTGWLVCVHLVRGHVQPVPKPFYLFIAEYRETQTPFSDTSLKLRPQLHCAAYRGGKWREKNISGSSFVLLSSPIHCSKNSYCTRLTTGSSNSFFFCIFIFSFGFLNLK